MGTKTVRSGHATYQLIVTLVSQNQAGNYSTLNVHLLANADSGWSGNASGIGFSATGYGSGTFSFNGSSIDIVNYNVNIGHDANGYCNYTINTHTNDTGTSTFAGPTDMSDSGALPRIKKAPKPGPAISAAITASREITVTTSKPSGFDDGGSAITNVAVQYSKDGGAWTTGPSGTWGARKFTGLAPGSYRFRAYATNAIGNSAYSSITAALQVVAGGKRYDTNNSLLQENWSFKDLSIMRRWDNTDPLNFKWVDIKTAKRATAAGNANWVDLTGA